MVVGAMISGLGVKPSYEVFVVLLVFSLEIISGAQSPNPKLCEGSAALSINYALADKSRRATVNP